MFVIKVLDIYDLCQLKIAVNDIFSSYFVIKMRFDRILRLDTFRIVFLNLVRNV